MMRNNNLKRREPLTDTQLLLTITICIFFAMYGLAMLVWGGGFLRFQQVFVSARRSYQVGGAGRG